MRIKVTTLLALLAFVFTYVQDVKAQDSRVEGIVTSMEDGLPMPGVTVLVKGTNRGTTTNADGEYSIQVPSGNDILVFSFVGFVTKEVQIDGRTTIDVELQTDVQQLSDVVVVGYGSQIREQLTGNVAEVSSEKLENVPVTSFESAIQGRASGVYVQQNNGKTGQGISIRIRGSSSVTANNQPLYVVDGIPVTSDDQSITSAANNPLSDLNFNDVENITVLKDASAAAIYGSRASNGVVLITTKSGQAGDTKFSLSTSTGFSEPTDKKEWLNGPEYLEVFDEAFVRSPLNTTGDINGTVFGFTRDGLYDLFLPEWDPNNDTEWQDLAFQDAVINKFDLSASGGTERTQFFVSGSLLDQDGILIDDYFQRLGGRLNLDHKANDNISIGMNLSLSRTVNDRLSTDNAFSTPVQLVAQSPLQPAFNDEGEPFDNTLYFNGLLYRDGSSFSTTRFRSLGNLFAEYNVTPNLSVRTELGVDVLNQNEERWFGASVSRNTGEPNGLGQSRWVQVVNYTTNTYANYQGTFADDHSVSATAGISFNQTDRSQSFVQGRNFPNSNFRTLLSAAEINGGNSTLTNYNFLSYFARSNYSWKDKWLFTASGRIDGSSRFGEDNRYGFFPAVSAGWILTEEDFLDSSESLSFLKLRASVGITGNAEIENFPALGLVDGGGAYSGFSGITPSQLANPDLKWEETTQYNFGLDFGLYEDRITGEVDYYIKKTNDLLLNVNVPGTSGFLSQTQNVGELENKGIEFFINTYNFVGEFSWSTSFNLSANTNKITDLAGQVIEGGFINRAVEGEAIGVFFQREFAGADPDDGDAVYYLNREPSQAELDDGSVYMNEGRFGDRYITDQYGIAERVVIGNPNPDFIGGISNTFSYKGFDLDVLFQFVYGNEIYNGGGTFQSASANFYDNQTADQLNRWQEPGDITDVPELRLFGGNGDGESSRYISDGSYLRLKNLTLGYTLPTELSDRLSLDRLRIYATGVNLLTFTDYDGWDPEVNTDFTAGNIGLGTDFYAAPQARTITLGVNIDF